MSNSRSTRFPDWALWIIGAATILAAAILILAVVLGVRAGQRQIEIQARQEVGIHLQRAIDFRAEGNLEAALAEYQQVMLLDPGNVGAVEGIESLLALAQGDTPPQPAAQPRAPEPEAAQAVATPPPAPTNSPLPTPAPTLSAVEEDWQEAERAYANGDWEEAAKLLEAIQALEPRFEADAVADMLFNSYVNLGAEKDQAGNLEEALALVDAALELRPNAEQLRTARSMAAAYLDVLTYSGANWEEAVLLLEELYNTDPDYRDVEERLQEARVALGDDLLAEEDWCDALEQYIAAIDIDVTPGLLSKRDRARNSCDDLSEVAAAPTRRNTATPRVTPRTSTRTPTRTPTPAVVANATPQTSPREGAADADATSTPEESVVAAATATATPAAPAGSPTRGRILFASVSPDDGRSRIYGISIAGAARPQLIVEDGRQPALRADSERLIYYNTREDMAGISSFDPGSGLNLRFTRFAEDNHPSWSPEGNRFVFASNREGDRRWRIYVAWADVDGEATNINFGESPAWHPNTNTIVFRGCDETGNRCGLWTMTGAGSGQAPLTSVPEDTMPAWSPDGQTVVFTSSGRHGNYDIYRVDTESGDVVRLTTSPANDGAATVSPDGQWVAFLSDRSGVWQIWAVSLNGGEAVQLADLPGGVGNWLDQSIQWVD
jgi:tetratricopeptide (TPR) repeat protein